MAISDGWKAACGCEELPSRRDAEHDEYVLGTPELIQVWVRHAASLQRSGTRCFGMSPRGEIAVPMARLQVTAVDLSMNAPARTEVWPRAISGCIPGAE